MTVIKSSNLNNIKMNLVCSSYVEMFHELLRVYSFSYSFIFLYFSKDNNGKME